MFVLLISSVLGTGTRRKN